LTFVRQSEKRLLCFGRPDAPPFLPFDDEPPSSRAPLKKRRRVFPPGPLGPLVNSRAINADQDFPHLFPFLMFRSHLFPLSIPTSFFPFPGRYPKNYLLCLDFFLSHCEASKRPSPMGWSQKGPPRWAHFPPNLSGDGRTPEALFTLFSGFLE